MAFIYCPVPKEITNLLFSMDVPGRKESPEDAHITLVYFDEDMTDDTERRIQSCLQSFYKVWPSGVVSTNKLTCFDKPGNIPVIFEIDGTYIHKLKNAICYCLDRMGISYSRKFPDFKPHITISYAETTPEEIEFDPLSWEIECVSFGSGTSSFNKTFHSYYFAEI